VIIEKMKKAMTH